MENKNIKFNKNGYLLAGLYELNTDELRYHFVDAFPNSETRPLIFDNYLRYVYRFQDQVFPYFEQWIDGSFVTQKENPKDMDLVTFVDHRVYDLRGDTLMDRFWSFSLESERLDAYIVKECEMEDETYPIYQRFKMRFLDLFGSDRTGNPKGFVKTIFSK